MPTGTLEERMAELEDRQDTLQRLLEERLPGEKRGWKAIVGTFEDDPLYDEAMRLGREWREAQHDDSDAEKR